MRSVREGCERGGGVRGVCERGMREGVREGFEREVC